LKEIDGLLEWTLSVDDYVDLESLKIVVQHPPFDPKGLDRPSPEVPLPTVAPMPVYVEPAAPKGLASTFGGKKRHAAAVEAARQAHQQQMAAWEGQRASAEQWYREALAKRERMEADRTARLSRAQDRYVKECEARKKEANVRNAELDTLINGLAFDLEDAITTYVGIVLANSVYPDHFPVEHDYSFDLASRELDLAVTVPDPSAVPTTKAYRWVKASDEITSVDLPIREQKARYANAVWQVAVRTIHEVFEADRAGKIHSISLTVSVQTVLPATGRPSTVPLVVVAVDRDTFLTFDLANVVPRETLVHLGAALSKSPFDLVPADTSRGVRARRK
jgi:restriction system protein